MEILEFGNKEKPKIILIHGFQSIWQIWEKYIDYYKEDYHLIVPIIEGHNPDKMEDFKSFNDSASFLENWYINNYGNEVYAIFGMSMGGILATTILKNNKLRIKKIILDGSPLASCNWLLKFILRKFYLNITHKTQKRNPKAIENARNFLFPSNREKEFLSLIDQMDDKIIIRFINAISDYKLSNNLDIKNTKIYYYHGDKLNEMLSKKTARYLKETYPSIKITCFKGTNHCEGLSMNYDNCIKILNEILKEGVKDGSKSDR